MNTTDNKPNQPPVFRATMDLPSSSRVNRATEGKPMTVIYNCKRCKTGKRVEYPLTGNYGNYRESSDGKKVFPGVYVQACGGGKPTVYGGDIESGLCHTCKRAMEHGKLVSHLVPEHKCDARCTSARGHNCECSCGGANHGAAWAA